MKDPINDLARKKARKKGGDLGSERSVMREVNQTNRAFGRRMKEDPENAVGTVAFPYRDKGGTLKYGTANARGKDVKTSRPYPYRDK